MSRQWRVRGRGQHGPVELIFLAEDINDAIRGASRRRVVVTSCVLIDDFPRIVMDPSVPPGTAQFVADGSVVGTMLLNDS
jgi:hypothetical protein